MIEHMTDHTAENIIFSKVNLVNAFCALIVSFVQIIHDLVPFMQDLAPFVTVGVGGSVMLYNLTKTFTEFKNNKKKK